MTSVKDISASAGPTNALRVIVDQIEAAASIEECLAALQSGFGYFQIQNYVLLPDDQGLFPILTCESSGAVAAGNRLQSSPPSLIRQAFPIQRRPQIPFKLKRSNRQVHLQNNDTSAEEALRSIGLGEATVLPIKGVTETAQLFFVCDEEKYEAEKLLAIQSICGIALGQVERLHRQPDGHLTGENLSNLEQSLIKGIASGRRRDDIAGDYGVSPHTISVFTSQITKKLGAKTFQQAISMASATTEH